MAKKQDQPPNPPLLVSLSRAAAELGINRKTLERARKRVPPLPTHGPGPKGAEQVVVAEVKAYLERQALGVVGGATTVDKLLREAPASTASTTELQDIADVFGGLEGVERALRLRPESVKKLAAVAAAKKERAEAAKKEQDVARARGLLVEAAEVERGRLARILVVKQGLGALPGKMAARLVGRTTEEIQAELVAEVDSLCRQFAEEFGKL